MVVQGCTPVSPGCDHCWAAEMDYRFGWGHTTPQGQWQEPDLTQSLLLRYPVRFNLSALRRSVAGPPAVIAPWNDLFHEGVLYADIGVARDVMLSHPEHVFMVLTKRIRRALVYELRYREFRRHMWIGTSVENRATLGRIEVLREFPGGADRSPRFVSFEPLLEDLGRVDLTGIDWVVVGCETGRQRRECEIDWIRQIVDQAQNQGLPVFVKAISIDGRVTHELKEFPPDLRVREWVEDHDG